MFFGKLFINLWAGEGYEEAYYVTLIALFAAAILRIQSGMNNVMKAKNPHGVPAIVYAVTSALSFPLSWILAEPFGLIGIVCGTGVGLIVGNVIIANVYYVRCVGMDLRLFCRETLSRLWLVVVITAIACYAASSIEGISIKTLFVQCAILVAVYGTSLALFGFNEWERAMLVASWRRLSRVFVAGRKA